MIATLIWREILTKIGSDCTVRLPDPFIAKVKRIADQQERSTAKQVMRWCQLGAAAEANPDLTGRELLQQYAARKDAIQ